MSIIDKVVAAVTPPESDEARANARAKAREVAAPGSWLAMVLDHHLQIEAAFQATRNASTAETRKAALKHLAVVLTGHSIAEESVLYPALALNGEKGHSEAGYLEQSVVKVQMAALDEIEPMSQDFLDKLEHIRGAVLHHMYEEEGTWFLELNDKVAPAMQTKLTALYQQEFGRYVGTSSAATVSSSMASAL